MVRAIKALIKGVRIAVIAWRRGVHIGSRCQIGFRTTFEGRSCILSGTTFSGRLGFGTYIGENCRLFGSIGRYCSISSDVAVIVGRHPTTTFVSTHPAFYSLRKQAGFTYAAEQLFEENVYADGQNSVVIGNDVLISHGVRILEGVTIGDGAILAAGSLVRSDVEPYSVYGGVPAKKIGQRFSDEVIRELLQVRWWDRGEEWIAARAPLFVDIERFLASCSGDAAALSGETPECRNP